MIIYNVTVNVEESVHEDWLAWMRNVHIPEVMSKGIFSGHRMFRVLADEGSGSYTYAIQYTCDSLELAETYRERFAPALQEESRRRYKDKTVAFRTLLELVPSRAI